MAHHRSDRRMWDSEWTQAHEGLAKHSFAVVPPATVLGTVERIPGGRGKPRRVYFTDPGGTRWRVYDAVFGPPDAEPFHQIAYAPPRVNARERIFIAQNGDRRSFAFNVRRGSRDTHVLALDAQTVTDQFNAAGYPACTREEEDDRRRNFVVMPVARWKPSAEHGIRQHTSTLNRWTAFDSD
jgi:hypothetical protein